MDIPRIKQTSLHRGNIILLLRVCLGGVFIYASLHKLHNTAQFKDAVANYELLPYWLINITAIILPWIEFWIGTLLIVGIFVRACTILNCSLLLLFSVAISINIARGLEIYCGCFSENDTIGVTNYWHIIFNALWLLMASVLFILERRRFSHRFFSKNAFQRQL